jgi:hypothetical protein
MTVLRVYCERGAWRRELGQLERAGKVELTAFPYEGKSRRTPLAATPSRVTCNETNVSCDSEILISDTVESEKYAEILEIVGRANELDVRHIDSAYKSGCAAFLTPDKDDIIAHRDELRRLLAMSFFHTRDDWNEFLRLIAGEET